MIDPCLYMFINRGLGMTPGKIAAQGGHAAVEGYRITPSDSNLLRLWYRGGHYKKIVLLGKNENHMRNIEQYLTARDIGCVTIIDEGHTEIEPLSITAIGCEVLDKNHPHVAATFSTFELYKELPTVPNPSRLPFRFATGDRPRDPTNWRFW
jgi:peptidyl-tRNA hydrolase